MTAKTYTNAILKVRASIKYTLLLCASIFLASCASVKNLEEPTVNVTSVSLLPVEGMEARFKVGLRVLNPNKQALPLQGMSFDVALEGFKVIRGVAKDLPTIAGFAEEEIFVEASTNLLQSFRLLTNLINDPKGKLAYTFGGNLDVGGLLPNIKLNDKGEINLTQE